MNNERNGQIAGMMLMLHSMSMDALEQALDELHADSIADVERDLFASSSAHIERAQDIIERIARTC